MQLITGHLACVAALFLPEVELDGLSAAARSTSVHRSSRVTQVAIRSPNAAAAEVW